jgi:hypothetical protein
VKDPTPNAAGTEFSWGVTFNNPQIKFTPIGMDDYDADLSGASIAETMDSMSFGFTFSPSFEDIPVPNPDGSVNKTVRFGKGVIKLDQAFGAVQGGLDPALVGLDLAIVYFSHIFTFDFGKKGKRQIVIGLLSGADGEPLAVRVFEGNTADPSTVSTQIDLLKQQFGVTEVVFIGDRGMLKAKGKATLGAEGWRYISALTKPQIRALLAKSVLQPDLFDEDIGEVVQDGKRLITRRNPSMQRRVRARRADKLQQLDALIAERNAFVSQSTRADPAAGLRQLEHWVKRHKLSGFVTLSLEQEQIRCQVDQAQLAEVALLDGCYVLETTVPAAQMDAQTVDARYRDLQKVERGFKTMKTDFLEVRPIFLRNGKRTKAHVFVAMLALKITRLFQALLHQAFGTTDDDPKAMTPEDALQSLTRLTYLIYEVKGTPTRGSFSLTMGSVLSSMRSEFTFPGELPRRCRQYASPGPLPFFNLFHIVMAQFAGSVAGRSV